mgnify:CR=1 FL=1
MPSRLTRPTVGFRPTSPFTAAGPMMLPSVSVPMAAVDKLAEGKIDIVIGTHKLLQDDVRFKDLGLCIIDEEHRFGVRQKEQIKALRSDVDILTLTATPIPRTLNMAMAGLRDLSIIATPPANRLAVQAFVSGLDAPPLPEAFHREIGLRRQQHFLLNAGQSIPRLLA